LYLQASITISLQEDFYQKLKFNRFFGKTGLNR
jgi:hypothetical protein